MVCYKGMTVFDGVKHVESYFTANELKGVLSFSDLHELKDANMALPFPEDCNDTAWLTFANAVVESFDRRLQSGKKDSV